MKIRLPSVALAVLAAGLIGSTVGAADDAAAYLVRHAEKAAGQQDPDLSPAGRSRAQALAEQLAGAGVAAIYVTDTARARQTAAPLAARLRLVPRVYDPRDLEALARTLKDSGTTALVVGHSNTTPDLARLLGGMPGGPIADDEYDRLYIIGLETGETGRAVAGARPAP